MENKAGTSLLDNVTADLMTTQLMHRHALLVQMPVHVFNVEGADRCTDVKTGRGSGYGIQ